MVIEEAEIETDVLGISSFPFQRAVFQSTGNTAWPCRRARTLNITLIEVIVCRNERQEIVVAQSILVTELSPAGTELQVADYCILREEWFLADSPTYSNRWEETPTAIGTELRRSILTEGELEEITVIVIIVQTAEERSTVILPARTVTTEGTTCSGTDGSKAGIQKSCCLLTLLQLSVFYLIYDSFAFYIYITPVILAAGERSTKHGIDAVLLDFLVEREYILEHLLLPVGTVLAAKRIIVRTLSICYKIRCMIRIYLVLTTITIAGLEVEPREELEG